MSQTIPEERVRIFNRNGVELVTFRATVNRSWAIGKEGRASFSYPSIKTDVVNNDVLRFGNYLLVENSSLPAWVGMIDTPRDWDDDKVVVNAFTMERLFLYRRGSDSEEKIKGSAGVIFEKMLEKINSAEKTILRAGDIWTAGQRREETFLPEPLERTLKRVQERSREEYSFTPSFANRRLVVRANWYQRLGADTQLIFYAANGGGNIEAPTMKEDEKIINEIYGYGDGDTWESKPKVLSKDSDSIDDYGLRQMSKYWNGVSRVATLRTNNDEVLAKQKNPRRIFQVSALNTGDTFNLIDLGNTARIVLQGMGFIGDGQGVDTGVRILGMSYNPETINKIKLVMEEI